MIDLLVQSRLTALPALLFLVCLPAFLWARPGSARGMLVLGSVAAIFVVAGPVLGTGLVVINLAGYALVELVARLPAGRRVGFVVGLMLLHAGYWGCFLLPVPAPFHITHLGPVGAAAYYVLFSGIALTFFRLITYFAARVFEPVRPLSLYDYLMYMLYYPQFRHGPIERAYEFVPKLRAARAAWSPGHLSVGLGRIGAGLLGLIALRVLVAIWAHYVPDAYDDNLRGMVTSSAEVAAIHIVLLVHLPAILLYLLESSYAHIQLGVSRAFGVVGSENFRAPFLATNPREFWHRWNITLFQWLRDYVYKPLRGHRGRTYRRLPALVLVFVYCGLLHGLEWRCVVWGLWTGGSLAAYLGVRGSMGRWWPERAASDAARRGGWSGLARRTLARLLVYEWFCIGVTIMLDVEGHGGGVLLAYGRVLFGWIPW